MRGVLILPVLACWLLAGPANAPAADPQPYIVTLQPTGIKAVDQVLRDSSTLISLKDKVPVGGFALVQRARQDADRFQTVLHSYGYYKSGVDITIAGHPLSDPALPDLITGLAAQPPVSVTAKFTFGPQFHLGRVSIDGSVPADAAAKLGLNPGAPAIAADVLAAQERLLGAIRDDGHPLAQVELEPATLHLSDNLVDVVFKAETGPVANFGPIQITGLQNMHEDFVRQRLLIHQGEKFSPAALDDARQDLMSLGVFGVVRMEPADHLDAEGNLPITVQVTERKLHAVNFGAGYSTDLGLNFTAGWQDRNLFGNAEQLNLTASTNFGGTAVTKPGYNFGAQFIKPDFPSRNEQIEIDLNAIKQSLQAYDQTATTQQILLSRRFPPHWNASIGLSGEQEQITQEGVSTHYNLVGVPVTVRYDSTNSLLDPTSGLRVSLNLTPTEAFSGQDHTFFIMQLSGSTYLNLSGDGRSVLAMRGVVGKIASAGVFSVPPDQRFYAGGSATVRGYRFQSVGPKFPDGTPLGGTEITAGSIEFRQRILGNYGMAAFVDAGQVSAADSPLSDRLRVGAGVGFRYYTSIGPIRLDVAVPLTKESGGDSFELYIGLGQAF
jgi:translocation and assembly module TamA